MTTIPRLDVDVRLPCQDRPDLYGAPDGERTMSDAYKRRTAAARTLCGLCPVRLECRDLGRSLREHDVWGGEDDKQRTKAGATPKPRTTRFEQPPCGTERGAQWHRRHGGGRPCEPCLKAATAASRERAAKKAAVRALAAAA